MAAIVIHNDVVSALADVAENTYDAVLCDPPYGLSFMGKRWDYAVPDAELWRAVLRVCKPGAALIAFSGTRTYHRTVVQIEDAGWEIRDSLYYLYGSGFPKSLDVAKAGRDVFCSCSKRDARHVSVCGLRDREDNAEGVVPAREGADVLPEVQRSASGCGVEDPRQQGPRGLDGSQLCERQGEDDGAAQPGVEGRRDGVPEARSIFGSAVREVPGGLPHDGAEGRLRDGAPPDRGAAREASAPAKRSRASRRSQPPKQRPGQPGVVAEQSAAQAGGTWPTCDGCGKPIAGLDGYGTALKPAVEPAVLARKPLDGTVAANVARYGTGALHIDACRIGAGGDYGRSAANAGGTVNAHTGFAGKAFAIAERDGEYAHSAGRWPANVIMDASAGEVLDAQAGDLGKAGVAVTRNVAPGNASSWMGTRSTPSGRPDFTYGDSGGASRFFYCAKASREERELGTDALPHRSAAAMTGSAEGQARLDSPRAGSGRTGGARNHHPTVKPVDLMRYLARLIMPPTPGKILVPFAGSGSEMIGALLAGWPDVTGIEREAEYVEIARARVALAASNPRAFEAECEKAAKADARQLDMFGRTGS